MPGLGIAPGRVGVPLDGCPLQATDSHGKGKPQFGIRKACSERFTADTCTHRRWPGQPAKTLLHALEDVEGAYGIPAFAETQIALDALHNRLAGLQKWC